MALREERHIEILRRLKEQGTVSVASLTQALGVSSNTVRRDLSVLEEQNLVRRTHGGAILVDPASAHQVPFSLREDEHREEKEAIGALAATLVADGDTVILDAGTTTLQVARNLVRQGQITVLTNSIVIASEFSNTSLASVILSGGIVRHTAKSLVGPPAERFFSEVHADKVFLAASGVDLVSGLSNNNMPEVPVKRAMIEAAHEVILIAGSHKFHRRALTSFASLDEIDAVVSDSNLSSTVSRTLSDLGIRVLLAEVSSTASTGL